MQPCNAAGVSHNDISPIYRRHVRNSGAALSPNAHFLIGEIQSGESEKGRLGGGMAASLAWHIGAVLFVIFMIARMPPPEATTAPPERMPDGCDLAELARARRRRWRRRQQES